MCTGNPRVFTSTPGRCEDPGTSTGRLPVDTPGRRQPMPSVVVCPCTIIIVVCVYTICRCSSVNHCHCCSCVCSYCSCVCSSSLVIVVRRLLFAMPLMTWPLLLVLGERSCIAHLDCVDGDNDMGIAIHLSMDGRVSWGGSKCRLVLPHTLQVSLCSGLPLWPFIDSGGGPLWPFMCACRLWWWVLMASGPSSLFVDGGAGRPWMFVGGHHHSSIMVVDPRSQSLRVVVGAGCVSWGL
jgi:hypothetical protein